MHVACVYDIERMAGKERAGSHTHTQYTDIH